VSSVARKNGHGVPGALPVGQVVLLAMRARGRPEAAGVLPPESTAKRQWSYTRLWLPRELRRPGE
jgi:hypothetical protein